jgi:ATP-dependent exoDNAse (exonuclease V) beta subunit
VIVVGDDRQAIYGFRGAVQDGMGMMRVTLRASTLGLTTTYRCPKAVVRIAAEIVPDYKAADSAPEGEVGTVAEIEKHVQIGDAILSRLNAPLMPLALSLLRKNIPARIEGRDIGRQLIGMVRTMKAKSVPHFIERVEGWLAKQIERLQKSKGADKKIEQSRDISETLKALAMDCKSVAEIEQRITNLFQDSDSNSKPAVVLSSVHKAKGLEWPRVFLLSETFRQKSGTGEEANIYYVAVTRAQKALYFVGGDAPKSANQVSESTPQSAKNKGNSQILPDGSEIIFSPSGGKPLLVPPLPPHFDSTKLQPVKVEVFPREEVRSLDNKQTGNESEEDMKKKTKKAAAPKAAAKPTGEKKTQVSYAGRGERIAELVAAKKTDNQILEIIKLEFPGSSTSPVLKTIASKRTKSAKGKTEARPEKKPAAKKPAKKAEKKAAAESANPTPVAEPQPETQKMTPPPRPGTAQE